MSEQVDMGEVKAKPNEFDEIFSASKNTTMVDKYSSNDGTTSESDNNFLIHFKISFYCSHFYNTLGFFSNN